MNYETLSSASASPTGTVADSRGNYRRTLTDFRALDRALSSGDLAAAREAFIRLQEDSPPLAEAASRDPFPHDNFHLRALKALGRALISGDLPGAKRAFHQFQ
jgi:hypothetical protein